MQTTRLFDVRCHQCDRGIAVPETILGEIAQYLQDSSTDADLLRFVCPHCKRRFRFDFQNRQDKFVGHEPLPLATAVDRVWFAIEAECDPSNSCPPITLVAIRPHRTNPQDVEREFPVWSELGLYCDNEHRIVKLSLL